jgi:HEPN domain-containing protein
VDRKEFQELSKLRLREAQALLSAGLSDGAYYLAGYSVECALKACIAKGTRRYEFPDKKRVDSSYTHSLPDLVVVAGLKSVHQAYTAASVEFRDNWELVQKWSEQSRYRRNDLRAAKALMKAVADKPHGVITWLRLHW